MKQMERLQSVQNTVARLVSDALRHVHITLILRWFPLCQLVIFQTFKSGAVLRGDQGAAVLPQ